jgi:hypothetical protein
LARIYEQCFVYDDTGDNPSDTVQPEQLEANLQSVAEAAFEAISDEAGSDSSEFSAAISQTLKHLAENAENLQVSNRNVNHMDFFWGCFTYVYDAVT